MRKTAKELEMLYQSSQEERKELRKIYEAKLVERQQKALVLNDFERIEIVNVLMQELVVKSKFDYFHAAVIYSRGEVASDYKRACYYAEQALRLNEENDPSDEFYQQVRLIYEHSFDKWKKSEGKIPRYGSKKRSDSGDNEFGLKINHDKTATPKPNPMVLTPLDPQKKDKDKKKEEELKAKQIVCRKCGDSGHSSVSCLKPKKPG